jgi:signal peptidase I
MDESTAPVDSSSSFGALPSDSTTKYEIEKYDITTNAIYVGDDLHLDLWIKTAGAHPQSIMIRSIDENGHIRSSFMHINGEEVRRVPTFGTGIELALESPQKFAPKELTWKEDKPRRQTKPVKSKEAAARARSPLTFALEILGVTVVTAVIAMLAFGALQLRTVLTDSMVPFLKPGDIVVAVAPQWVAPKIGDVAIYHARDLQGNAVSSWAHRIIAGNATEGYTFKGDANPAPDLNHPKIKDIEGVMLFKVPALGKYLNPITVGLCIAGIALITWAKRRW